MSVLNITETCVTACAMESLSYIMIDEKEVSGCSASMRLQHTVLKKQK